MSGLSEEQKTRAEATLRSIQEWKDAREEPQFNERLADALRDKLKVTVHRDRNLVFVGINFDDDPLPLTISYRRLMTRAQKAFYDRIEAAHLNGRRWITARTVNERTMARRMVKAGLIDTDDGYIFEKHDPDKLIFQGLLESVFFYWATGTGHVWDKAVEQAAQCMQIAQSDGQGGWDMLWKVTPPVWDGALARKMAVRFLDPEDECL